MGKKQRRNPKPTSKGVLKKAKLPTSGKIRYVPPKYWYPTMPLPRGPGNGYIDRFANEWVWNNRAGHWDVQLSPRGLSQYERFSKSGEHINVTTTGRIDH